MIRVETALILRTMLDYSEPINSEVLAEALDLTLTNLNRRTKALYTQRMIGRELRYGKHQGEKSIYLHITDHGVKSLEAYDERRKERPTVATKHPIARVKKAPKQHTHIRNSIFNN